MKFIPLSDWKQLYPELEFPVESADQLRGKSDAPVLAGLSLTEKEWWFHEMTSQQSVVFLKWVHADKQLTDLIMGSFAGKRLGSLSISTHALFPEFRKFISRFVAYEINRQLKQGGASEAILSYSVLLDRNDLVKIEATLTDVLEQRIFEFKERVQAAKSFAELQQALFPMIDAETVSMLNAVPEECYALRKNWVDTVLIIASHPETTRQLMLQTVKELQKISLNADHRAELKQFQSDVMTGVKTVEEEKRPWWKMAVAVAGVLIIGYGLWWVWDLQPEPVTDVPENDTAFMAFTKEERQKLDSLLQVYTHHESEEQIDDYDVTIGEDLRMARELNNQAAEDLLSRWSFRDTTTYTFDTTAIPPACFPTTKDLRSAKGTSSAFLYNESAKQLLVVCFDNRSGAPLYSAYVQPGKVVQFGVKAGTLIYALPGDYAKAKNQNDMPFQLREYQFFEQLSNPSEVVYSAPKRFKLVWKDAGADIGYLVDMNGALSGN